MIPIPVPTGRRYKASVTAWVWRAVRCEQCDCEYAYRIRIVGSGQALSPLWLNNTGARARAQQTANDSFDRKVQNQTAAINCPQCNYLQKDMVSMLKKRRYILFIATTLACLLSLATASWATQLFNSPVACFGMFFLWIDIIILFEGKGLYQGIYSVAILIMLGLLAFKGINLALYTAPLSVLIILVDGLLALKYNPQKNPWRPGSKPTYQILVVRRAELEAAASQFKAEHGKDFPMPRWT